MEDINKKTAAAVLWQPGKRRSGAHNRTRPTRLELECHEAFVSMGDGETTECMFFEPLRIMRTSPRI